MQPQVIVPLDYPNTKQALDFVAQINPELCRLKVGKELFTRAGPDFVDTLQKQGFEIFLDVKYHDIPNTVAAACRAAADMGVWMLNVHAFGGLAMLQAASEAVSHYSKPPILIGVTLLTSMDSDDLLSLGIQDSPAQTVSRLAALTVKAGLQGVVCSAHEAQTLRQECGKDFILVTPGIRPQGSANGDQKRVMTPTQALLAGSDYLVIGRPITQSDNPYQTLLTINKEVSDFYAQGK